MWNLPRGDKFLPATQVKKLEKLYKKEKNVKAKTRLLAAIHRKEEKSVDRIAEIIHQKKRTVHEWLWNFHERGLEAKDTKKQTGRPSKLSYRQRRELAKMLERGPPRNPSGLWTSKEIREFIRKKYGISYVPQHIWRIMQSLGFRLQRPRKKHYKSASIEEIEHFKKRLSEKRYTTERKGLLWVQKTRQRSG